MEFFFIKNVHLRGFHISYFIKSFLPLKPTQFINSPLKLINFDLFYMWTCHNAFMVPKSFIFNRVPNKFLWNFQFGFDASQFQQMILVGHIVFDSIVSVTFSNLFCSPLWKVTVPFRLIFGYFSHSGLLTWLMSTLSCKTCSILFFILIVNTVGILL